MAARLHQADRVQKGRLVVADVGSEPTVLTHDFSNLVVHAPSGERPSSSHYISGIRQTLLEVIVYIRSDSFGAFAPLNENAAHHEANQSACTGSDQPEGLIVGVVRRYSDGHNEQSQSDDNPEDTDKVRPNASALAPPEDGSHDQRVCY
jgi:hypothetical protein